ncbi:outer membrane beta-barrel protein [Hymenobacter sp. BT175]|uniref:outer membrane beta-barrel protein n=1 Tax=Hymenobacter translucens TaxID=2886507 RepID=UPI001D0EE97F|nr:outer membrane beta-barrel protein [Hymenobacter translucens]MCC2546477.1 outer membrane beta-barrel protein [Hymenobacter translucens]
MRYLLLLGLWLGCFLASAQKAPATSGKSLITGMVLDSTSGQPLREASVSLLAAKDSTYLSFTITDGDGRFTLRNVAPGRYQLLLTFLGYPSRRLPVQISQPGQPLDLGTLRLLARTNMLGEVKVVEEKAPVSMRGDTLAFNANAFKTQPNAAVETMLKKLPGVEVDRDGTIRAQGREVNRVLVDGKPFFGDDPRMATRNLPANIIDQVQLYDQQSDQAAFSGIDDGNRQRTINLVTKRDKRKGYFGANGGGIGTDGRYSARLGVNRFNNGRQISALGMANNVNQLGFSDGSGGTDTGFGAGPGGPVGRGGAILMAGGGRISTGQGGSSQPASITESAAGGLNYRDAWGKRTEVATSYLASRATEATEQQLHRVGGAAPGNPAGQEAQALVTDQDATGRVRTDAHRFNLRLDYRLDTLTTLRFTPFASWQNAGTSRENRQQSMLGARLLNMGQNRYAADGTTGAGSGNLLLLRKFGRQGRTFSANLTAGFNDQSTNAISLAENTRYGVGGVGRTEQLNQRLDQQNGADNRSLNLSYAEPLSLTTKVEAHYGFASNLGRSNRAVTDFSVGSGQYDQPNAQLSNQFSSDFQTHRGGLTVQNRRLRYTYSLGLDAQQSELGVANQTADTTMTRRYVYLLPNALLTFTAPGGRNFRLDYRPRVQAPAASQLQPVADYTNPLNIQAGNPNLRPEYVHTLTATYNQFNAVNNRSVFLLLNGTRIEDRIVGATTFDPSGAQTTRPVNADGYAALNGFLSLGQRWAARKLNLNLTTNGNYSRSPGFVNGLANEARTWSVGQGVSLNSSFNEKLELGLSANLTYRRARYALLPGQNTDFFTQTLTADLYYHLTDRLVLTTDFWYRANPGGAAGYGEGVALWNAGITQQLFRNKQGELKLQLNDVLNQNQSLVRNVTDTYVEDVRSRVLTRYLLLSFTYNLRHFGV